MDSRITLIGGATAAIALVGLLYVSKISGRQYPKNLFTAVKEPQDIAKLFPTSARELQKRVNTAITDAKQAIEAIIAIPDSERTFENTAKAFDKVATQSDVAILGNAIVMVRMINPDAALRDAAQKACEQLLAFDTEELSNNIRLYKALKAYVDQKAPSEKLSKTEQYLLDETMKRFKLSGLDLPEEKQQEVRNLKNEINALTLQFDANIDSDNSFIGVSREELAGLPDDFINSLKRLDDGSYRLGVDYPTYIRVMERCDNASTREKLWKKFNNRAYPANDKLLQEIAAKRAQLAAILGFANYATYDIYDTMAHTPETASALILDTEAKLMEKEKDEFELFTKELPEGVIITADSKLQPWDVLYCKEQYKRNHLQFDELAVAEYFPMEKTIDGLMKVYEQFFDLQFTKLPATNLWDKNLSILQINDRASQKLLGYLILDLYPRPNKYGHACQETLVPAISLSDEPDRPWVGIIVGNFPPSTADKPSLLKRGEVEVIFHELGHAMHALFARRSLGLFAGLHVKFDFVEVPSQMFEEWLFNPDVLKTISKHYKTDKPLSDELIKKIIDLKKFAAATHVQRQCSLAMLSMRCFEGKLEKPHDLLKELFVSMRPHVAWCDDDHMYCSFGHLTGYGSKYYTYMWSKVYALDLADTIKEGGFLNPVVGNKLRKEILSKGGSEEPMTIMTAFLGRAPNNKAFLKDIGIDN